MENMSKFGLNMSNSDDSKFYRQLSKIVAFEVSNISGPCYFPKFIKYWRDLHKTTNFDAKQIKEFKKFMSPEFKKFAIFNDSFNVFLYICIIHYTNKNNKNFVNLIYKFLAVKQYSHLVHKYFPEFCRNDLWELALNQVSPRHLFKVHKGVPNAVTFISDAEFAKIYPKLLKATTDKQIFDFVYALRSRIEQSMRSFANLYYELYESNVKGITSSDGEEEGEVIERLADKLSTVMCTYEQIDKIALLKAISMSGLKKETCVPLISELSSVAYRDKIKFILILICRIRNPKDVCLENKRNSLVRKIESKVKVVNYEVRKEILKVLYETEMGYQLKKLNSSQLNMFFCHYITMFMRSKICV